MGRPASSLEKDRWRGFRLLTDEKCPSSSFSSVRLSSRRASRQLRHVTSCLMRFPFLTLVLLGLLGWSLHTGHRFWRMSRNHPLMKYHYTNVYLPWLATYEKPWGMAGNWYRGTVKALYEAPWAGSWPTPELTTVVYADDPGSAVIGRPRAGFPITDHRLSRRYKGMGAGEIRRQSTIVSPAILSLDIFSMPTGEKRVRRDLIRQHHPLNLVHPAYRHLIDVRFVLGRADPLLHLGEELSEAESVAAATEWAAAHEEWPNWSEARREAETEAKEISAEQQRYGDLIQLDGLVRGENMDEGKTIEWFRVVGTGEAGRDSQWVVKCDDDVSRDGPVE